MIPFQMPWQACGLTLDRVKCLHYPLNAAPSANEVFFYVHPLKQGDTYASIQKTIPVNVKSSNCFKGIVIICNKLELDPTFWADLDTRAEILVPLYLVEDEHQQFLLKRVQPQQPPSRKAGLVQSQAAQVQLDKPDALYIRFIPESGGKCR